MPRAVFLLVLATMLAIGCLGCRGEGTAPGTATATRPFGKMKEMKPPPPKVPTQ